MSTSEHPLAYEIRVAVRLDQRWESWFDPLALRQDSDGSTVLLGQLPDQAALHGVLQRIRDAGLPLLSVTPLPKADDHERDSDGDLPDDEQHRSDLP